MFLMFHNAPPSEVADKMLHGMLDSASDIRPLRWCGWLCSGLCFPQVYQGSAIRLNQGFYMRVKGVGVGVRP